VLASHYFYMGVQAKADSQQVLKQIVSQSSDLFLDTMRRDVLGVFPSMQPYEEELGGLFGRIKAEFPEFVPPKYVYSVVSGFTVDILYLDSLMLLGLEHFMPDTAHYETPQIPHYIRKRMRPNTLVPGVAKLLSDKFIRNDFSPEPALVEDMIRWGKVLYFTKTMLPCLPDTLLFGYSAEVMEDVNKNAPLIYAHFVDKALFFNTDHLLRAKYVGERPSIPEIGDKCPGRIGQWMGYQIVRKWAEEKDLSVAAVMKEPNAQKIFNEARWKPKSN
jgi:hypothetical protein